MHVAQRPGGTAAIHKIVLHLNVGPEVEGGARGLVNYLQGVDAGYHEVIDDKEFVVAARPDQVVEGASGMNEDGYHACVIANIQSFEQWHDPYSTAELEIAALRMAALCHQFGVPPVLLTDDQIADRTSRGICDHWGVNRAIVLRAVARGDHSMGPGDHTDVGAGFPWVEFIAKVVSFYYGTTTPVVPKPVQKVVPIMYSPALHVAAVLQDTPQSPARAGVAPDGSVFVWDASLGYHGGANGKAYFAGRIAARLQYPSAAQKAAGKVYVIIDTAGHPYAYPE